MKLNPMAKKRHLSIIVGSCTHSFEISLSMQLSGIKIDQLNWNGGWREEQVKDKIEGTWIQIMNPSLKCQI